MGGMREDIRFGCSSSPGKGIQKSCQAQSDSRWLPSMLHAAEPCQYESIPVRGSSRCHPSPLGLGTGRPRSIGPRDVRIGTDDLAARPGSLNSIRSHRVIPLGPWAGHRCPHILGILAKEANEGGKDIQNPEQHLNRDERDLGDHLIWLLCVHQGKHIVHVAILE